MTMSGTRSFALVSAFVGIGLLAQPQHADAFESPVGVWKTIDDETGEAKSLVKLYEKDGVLYGRIVKLFKDPDATCDACEGEDKGAPINGMVILWGLEENDGEWSGGKIFDPKKGKTYRAKLWLEGNELVVRGYAGPFYRTQTWRRAE